MRLAHVLFLGLLALLLVPSVHAQPTVQARSFIYRQIDVTLVVNRDATLDVTEDMTLSYTGGPFTHMARSIPHTGLDAIRNVTLSERSTPYRQAASDKEPGSFRVSQGNETLIDWYYEPTSDGERSFSLHYQVDGALHSNASTTTLHWSAVHASRGAAVLHSQVSVWMPPGVDAKRIQVRLPSAGGQTSRDERAVFVQRDEALADDQPLDISVSFPAAQWRPSTAGTAQKSLFPPGLIFCGLVLIIIVVMCLFFYLIIRYARKTGIGTSSYSSSSYTSSSDGDWSSGDSGYTSSSFSGGGWSSGDSGYTSSSGGGGGGWSSSDSSSSGGGGGWSSSDSSSSGGGGGDWSSSDSSDSSSSGGGSSSVD